MARPRLTIGTFGDITVRTMSSGRVEARTLILEPGKGLTSE